MNPEEELARKLRQALALGPREVHHSFAERFAGRVRQVAAHPDRVPIELDGEKLEARLGGTLLAAALKNRKRLMHACGARTLCSTCRVKVEGGGENLSPMTLKEKLSLRYHLSLSSRTRLACQARVLGPVEVESVFPLCGRLNGE